MQLWHPRREHVEEGGELEQRLLHPRALELSHVVARFGQIQEARDLVLVEGAERAPLVEGGVERPPTRALALEGVDREETAHAVALLRDVHLHREGAGELGRDRDPAILQIAERVEGRHFDVRIFARLCAPDRPRLGARGGLRSLHANEARDHVRQTVRKRELVEDDASVEEELDHLRARLRVVRSRPRSPASTLAVEGDFAPYHRSLERNATMAPGLPRRFRRT